MSLLKELNKEQRVATEKIEGPILVLAGAGSGKTRALTHRIAHMIRDKGIDPYNILALTFTNKASKEMKLRINELLKGDLKDLFVSTFHSFATRFLRSNIQYCGLSSNFNIYDVDDQKKLIGNIIKSLKTDVNIVASKVVGRISKLKESKIFPDNFKSNSSFDDTFLEIYRLYQQYLKENNAIDFADILIYADRMLDVPEVLKQMQDRFKYILVDEYQDTNQLQYDIVKKLASKNKNIFVVGDEDQSIYKFRGADISNILNFEKDYSDALICKLERNYRSTSTILEAANCVIKNNTTSRGKKLWTERKDGDLIICHEADDSRKEAKYVAAKIKEMKESDREYKDISILYRSNAQSRELEEEFIRERIPYRIYGGMQFYKRKEVKDILAYLSFINNSSDTVNFLRIVNLPQRGIGSITLEKLVALRNENRIESFLDVITKAIESPNFSTSIKISLDKFKEMLDEFISYSKNNSVKQLMEKVIEDSGYMKLLSDNNENDRTDNIRELINTTEIDGASPPLQEYLSQISLASNVDYIDDNENYVKLMTIHNSKGLEFPIVFIVGLEEELFPHSASMFDKADLEEERRLFYVAMTRAKDKLFFVSARTRMIHGTSSHNRERSRFIGEIPEHLLKEEEDLQPKKRNSEALFRAIEDMKKRKSEAKKQIEESNKAQVEKLRDIVGFALGDKVLHKMFGKGKIVSLNLDQVTVYFEHQGEKKFLSSMAIKFISKI